MIRRTELDGVPVLIAPARGPVRAGLAFRVGQADETLATHGITHLVEHLAIHSHGVTDYHVNGGTGATLTQFVVQGTAAEVADYLTGVCAALRNLPLDRLDTEKDVLRIEASGRSHGPVAMLPLWRHGARGHGLLSYPEFGLRGIGRSDVEGWSRRWFNRSNAVLWIAGDEIPAGLRLDLPDGERAAFPAMTSALPVTPAYFGGPENNLTAELLVGRSVAATTYSILLKRLLHVRLRQDAGLSYSAETAYFPQSRDLAQVIAYADTRPDAVDAAVRGFVAILRELARGEMADADFAAAVKTYQDVVQAEDNDAARLPGAAFDHFTGYRHRTAAEIGAAIGALTPADLRVPAEQAARSVLMMVPGRYSLAWAGFESAPERSRWSVTGRSYRSRLDPDDRLVVADDGVSAVNRGGPATVLFSECEAMLSFPDGGRRLIGTDGIVVAVEPAVYGMAPDLLDWIDAAVPPGPSRCRSGPAIPFRSGP